MKQRIYEILEKADPDDRVSRLFDIFIIALILLNVAAVILETVGPLYADYKGWFTGFELFTVAVFTAEYILRLWSCTADPRFEGSWKGRLRFAFTPLAVIDLIAILPFWLTLMQVDARIIRLVRIFRLLRLAKLGRYSLALQTLARVFVKRREELMVTVLLMAVLLVIASAFIYYAEHKAQPEAFSSIPAAMWWAVATLTTVGYGDIYPITTLGKVLGGVIAALGIGMFALPTGVLGSAFMEEIDRRKAGESKPLCPHCGGNLDADAEGHSESGPGELPKAS